MTSSDVVARGHAERAAINTPIQGGAADVVTMAMINIFRQEALRDMGWKMVLQVKRRRERDARYGKARENDYRPNELSFNYGTNFLSTAVQVHDEIILEGPEQQAQHAFDIVKECMEKPFAPRKLLVALPVDGAIVNNWYEAK